MPSALVEPTGAEGGGQAGDDRVGRAEWGAVEAADGADAAQGRGEEEVIGRPQVGEAETALGGRDSEVGGEGEGGGAGGAGEDAAVGRWSGQGSVLDQEDVGAARLEDLVAVDDQRHGLAELGLDRLEPVAIGPLVG